jgi:hypothetical protein
MNYLQIPSAVWPHLSHLSGLQLAIYCDAITWTSQGKEARRSNDTLAEMFGVTSRAISKAVARMVELGFVDVEVGPNNIRSIRPRTTVHLNKRSPRTTVHPEQLFTTPLNNCSPQHGTTVHGSPEQVFTLVNHIEEQREEHRGEQKEPKPKKAKPERQFHDVVLPWDTDTFRTAWREWLDYKWEQHRFAYKRAKDEQTALHTLQKSSKNDERIAIHIIATSVANGWKGLFANSAKSYVGPGARTGYGFTTSGKYAHPADVLTDSSIWG